jgi:hypothetical protein
LSVIDMLVCILYDVIECSIIFGNNGGSNCCIWILR